ncbi:hypothetical protein CMQ_3266 [Grosmannia clavigera kw1407]|uniref:Uncharacterized protein n=1 Tax=Grosmannia clavigera (strain kw1407 / UAMH 11150) TaxID=655863 RepID=F0X991_GROCL|nr:uncharacterized protein CMQ_3266 [Grosmannia clavigera kw1407]EFX05197.1 hypothetical protein CMQ_3266 [Grosmannia clavigera kw1407]
MDYDDGAVTDDAIQTGLPLAQSAAAATQELTARLAPSPSTKTRSLSDGGCSTSSCRRLSPPPLFLDPNTRRTCRDDSFIGSSTVDTVPVTPRRPSSLQYRGASLQLPASQPPSAQQPQHPSTPASSSSAHILQQQQQFFLNQPTYMAKPTPLSPKLDPSQIYASPTNILPRRSRGLDFSRAATSLHHSTLAEQSSPDSSPLVSGSHAAMNIPGRKPGDYGGATESSTSLWSMMGRSQEKAQPSGSLGSVNYACSDSSSSSDDNDLMDEDLDEPFVTTPQVGRVTTPSMTPTAPSTQSWMPGSPAMNSLLSFQNRQRPRKQPRRKVRGPLGLGFSSIFTPPPAASPAGMSTLSRSPPGYILGRDGGTVAAQQSHARRESISWAANQLHISGSESDDSPKAHTEAGEGPVLTPGRDGQRGVVRRVVTRRGNLLGFARIRAALAEESTPVESDFRREAEVVRQVLESDMEPELLRPRPPPPLRSVATTPNSSPNMPENLDDLADDVMAMDAASAGLGLSVGAKLPTDRRRARSPSMWANLGLHGASARTTPPRQPSCLSPDDVSMDSPLGTGSGSSSNMVFPSGAVFALTASSSRGDTPQPGLKGTSAAPAGPANFKRRAVSPGMSVHNSPITQSPLQRDTMPWGGPSSRPGSNSGSLDAKFFPPLPISGISGGSGGAILADGTAGVNRAGGSKGRVGYQTMADANDSITRLSIE